MPDMVVRRMGHGQVAAGSKLFVVGGEYEKSCECFNAQSNRFALFTPPNEALRANLAFLNALVAFGGKLSVFKEFMGKVLYYDVSDDVWSAETCQALKDVEHFSCAPLF